MKEKLKLKHGCIYEDCTGRRYLLRKFKGRFYCVDKMGQWSENGKSDYTMYNDLIKQVKVKDDDRKIRPKTKNNGNGN